MKAVILAGGKGTRLAPYTTVLPKPMLPVGDKPILETIIAQLAHHGFREIVLSVGHLAGIIKAYFQANGNLPPTVTVKYVHEDKPLGTAASVGLVPGLDKTFLVMNGDVLTTLDYSELVRFHKENDAVLTIATYSKRVPIDVGMVEVNGGFRVVNYREKPTFVYNDSMGIYVYEPAVLKYIEPGVYLDLPTLVNRLVSNGEKVVAYQTDNACYWIDMGRHGDYEKAVEAFEANKERFLPSGVRVPIRQPGFVSPPAGYRNRADVSVAKAP